MRDHTDPQYSLAGTFFILLYYLPYYFQSVGNVSASDSGVRNLPLVIAASLFTIVAGVSISKTGHYWPVLLLGGILATIGAGLVYSLDIGSSSGEWIGYQVFVGIGKHIPEEHLHRSRFQAVIPRHLRPAAADRF